MSTERHAWSRGPSPSGFWSLEKYQSWGKTCKHRHRVMTYDILWYLIIWLAFEDNLKSPAGYGMKRWKKWLASSKKRKMTCHPKLLPDRLGRVGAQPGDQEPCRAAGLRLGQVPTVLVVPKEQPKKVAEFQVRSYQNRRWLFYLAWGMSHFKPSFPACLKDVFHSRSSSVGASGQELGIGFKKP